MKFRENQIFHIYNQGNNRRQLFYSEDNYAYFLWKMKAYLLPFGDLIAYCLMPNHFQWQFYVKHLAIPKSQLISHKEEIELERKIEKYGLNTFITKCCNSNLYDDGQIVTLNQAIGTLQQSYTKALNKRMGWTGSLFREKCKAKDGFSEPLISANGLNQMEPYQFDGTRTYSFLCFEYIHRYPEIAGLVLKKEDYPWSSARDYLYELSTSICNMDLGRQFCGK